MHHSPFQTNQHMSLFFVFTISNCKRHKLNFIFFNISKFQHQHVNSLQVHQKTPNLKVSKTNKTTFQTSNVQATHQHVKLQFCFQTRIFKFQLSTISTINKPTPNSEISKFTRSNFKIFVLFNKTKSQICKCSNYTARLPF